jgi:hypothetical protein
MRGRGREEGEKLGACGELETLVAANVVRDALRNVPLPLGVGSRV